jgi:hypothetical protein
VRARSRLESVHGGRRHDLPCRRRRRRRRAAPRCSAAACRIARRRRACRRPTLTRRRSLRAQSEIKHGRVAMAGFVGYIVHANGIRFPYAGPWDSIPADISPQAQWDALPEAGKWQIILTIGFFEFWRENAYVLSSEGQSHYMRGGKPGYFPTFDQLPHPVPFNLFDPFGFTKSASAEKKAKSLIAEVNNGRLAMIGLMGFLAESKVPGSVPALSGIVKSYDGNVMAPFDANFHIIG